MLTYYEGGVEKTKSAEGRAAESTKKRVVLCTVHAGVDSVLVK